MLATCVLKRHITYANTWRFYFRVDEDVDPARSFTWDDPDDSLYVLHEQYTFPDDPFPPQGANLVSQ